MPADREYQIETVYSDVDADVLVAKGRLTCYIPEDMRAVAVLLKEIR